MRRESSYCIILIGECRGNDGNNRHLATVIVVAGTRRESLIHAKADEKIGYWWIVQLQVGRHQLDQVIKIHMPS